MKIDPQDYRVKEGEKIDLKQWPTQIKPIHETKEEYRDAQAKHVKKLSEIQSLLYADGRYSILLIFQAMDAAGKDGAIKHVMSGVNPQGCQVFSYKQPSAQELHHDFLWRTTRDLPERGKIGIFNRSYYEEVLIAKVHPEILKAEQVADGKNIWEERYQSIVDLEDHLYRNGTRVIKFFLHLSKEEQRQRFIKRLERPDKNWKFSMDDIKERAYWKDYRKAYEACLSATSTETAPWYIVPADYKPDTRLIISEIIRGSMEKMRMSYPKPDKAHRKELEEALKTLKLNNKED